MIRQLRLGSVLIATVLFLSSCINMGPSVSGNGNVIEQQRNVGEFKSIRVSHGLEVIITQGLPVSLTVQADENIHESIVTEVNKGILFIKTDEHIRRAKSRRVLITTDQLEGIETSSGSRLRISGLFKEQTVELAASSGSQMNLDLSVKRISVKTSSGANIHLKGRAESGNFRASSGSRIHALDFVTGHVESRASSGANIRIHAAETFSGSSSSGSSIHYRGNPKTTDLSSSSGGNVRPE